MAEVAAVIIAVKITHAYTHTHIEKHRQNMKVDEMNDPDPKDLKDSDSLSFPLKVVLQRLRISLLFTLL